MFSKRGNTLSKFFYKKKATKNLENWRNYYSEKINIS